VNPGARSKVLAAIVTTAVAAAVIAAIVLIGAPGAQRQRKMDGVRVQNLTYIALSVKGYFTRHKELPPDLDALAKEPGYRVARSDPDTGIPYGYQILGTTSYRLCADFTTDTSTDTLGPYNAYVDVSWAHGKGHQCFDRNTERIGE
jgi:type II secretory pathway pseudopilin PulG